MTKYIKGKDGKFQGSIGDGKTAVPSPAPAMRVIPATALFEAFRANPEATVRIDELAEAYHATNQEPEPQPSNLSDLYFGTNFAEPREDDDAADWGERILAGIEQEDVDTFRDDFLSSAHITRSGEEYVIHIYKDEEENEATLRYSPSYNIAFVETYLDYDGDFSTTEDLAPKYRDAIKDEIRDNRRQDLT